LPTIECVLAGQVGKCIIVFVGTGRGQAKGAFFVAFAVKDPFGWETKQQQDEMVCMLLMCVRPVYISVGVRDPQ